MGFELTIKNYHKYNEFEVKLTNFNEQVRFNTLFN